MSTSKNNTPPLSNSVSNEIIISQIGIREKMSKKEERKKGSVVYF
jgi:hypothetical protein